MDVGKRLKYKGVEIRYLTLTFCEKQLRSEKEWEFERLWNYLNQSDLIKQWLVDLRLIPLRFGRVGENQGDKYSNQTYWMVEFNLSHPYFSNLSLEEQWLEIQRIKVECHKIESISDIHFYLILDKEVEDDVLLYQLDGISII